MSKNQSHLNPSGLSLHNLPENEPFVERYSPGRVPQMDLRSRKVTDERTRAWRQEPKYKLRNRRAIAKVRFLHKTWQADFFDVLRYICKGVRLGSKRLPAIDAEILLATLFYLCSFRATGVVQWAQPEKFDEYDRLITNLAELERLCRYHRRVSPAKIKRLLRALAEAKVISRQAPQLEEGGRSLRIKILAGAILADIRKHGGKKGFLKFLESMQGRRIRRHIILQIPGEPNVKSDPSTILEQCTIDYKHRDEAVSSAPSVHQKQNDIDPDNKGALVPQGLTQDCAGPTAPAAPAATARACAISSGDSQPDLHLAASTNPPASPVSSNEAEQLLIAYFRTAKVIFNWSRFAHCAPAPLTDRQIKLLLRLHRYSGLSLARLQEFELRCSQADANPNGETLKLDGWLYPHKLDTFIAKWPTIKHQLTIQKTFVEELTANETEFLKKVYIYWVHEVKHHALHRDLTSDESFISQFTCDKRQTGPNTWESVPDIEGDAFVTALLVSAAAADSLPKVMDHDDYELSCALGALTLSLAQFGCNTSPEACQRVIDYHRANAGYWFTQHPATYYALRWAGHDIQGLLGWADDSQVLAAWNGFWTDHLARCEHEKYLQRLPAYRHRRIPEKDLAILADNPDAFITPPEQQTETNS